MNFQDNPFGPVPSVRLPPMPPTGDPRYQQQQQRNPDNNMYPQIFDQRNQYQPPPQQYAQSPNYPQQQYMEAEAPPQQQQQLQHNNSLWNTNYEIAVGAPQKHDDGVLSSHYSYRIQVETNLPCYHAPRFSVSRRFSDFEWLSNLLCRKYPGVFMPPLPEKSALLQRTNAEFLETRRAGLERFLKRIAGHPLLEQCPELIVFLQGDDATFEAAKITMRESAVQANPNASKTPNGLVRLFQGIGESFTTMFVDKDVGTLPSDPQFEHLKSYVDKMHQQLQQLATATNQMVNARRAMASAQSTFGLYLKLVGDNDTDALGSVVASCAREFDVGAIRIQGQANEEALLEERIKYYVAVVGSAKDALGQRATALATYQRSFAAVEKKKKALQDAERSGNESKIITLRSEVEQAEMTAAADRDFFETVTRTTRQEMQRFHRTKLFDFKQLLLDFIGLLTRPPQDLSRLRHEVESLDERSLPTLDQ
eukprot:gnl/Spiro4/22006_TR10812_c0_g1_i1.p1 gnl/Spiro4/22006_TR10812_c0_g1~~gnl/Spiro4/22006_TR10812_c0_g1_i1.p1  ORF type:complete len:480 (-),score=103.35 gnl/Spiro4/22006_TR10812_c0_g1_i1:72-1511(-)